MLISCVKRRRPVIEHLQTLQTRTRKIYNHKSTARFNDSVGQMCGLSIGNFTRIYDFRDIFK